MNTVNINGKTYTAPDNASVSVINGKVYFNGKLQEDFKNWKDKKIEIIIEGNCKDIKCDTGNITVKGNVEGNITADTGNIDVKGDIRGNVTTDCGNIRSHHIFGNVSTDIGIINGSNKSYRKVKSNNWLKEIFEDIFG